MAAAPRIAGVLPLVVDAPDDDVLRADLLESAALAARVLQRTGPGPHQIVTQLVGGRTGAPHGVVSAMLLPHTVARSRRAARWIAWQRPWERTTSRRRPRSCWSGWVCRSRLATLGVERPTSRPSPASPRPSSPADLLGRGRRRRGPVRRLVTSFDLVAAASRRRSFARVADTRGAGSGRAVEVRGAFSTARLPRRGRRGRESGVLRAGRPRYGRGVTIIKINAITVPAGAGDELARRFAARVGAVDNQDGFEGFELLQPDRRPHDLAGRHPLARRGRVPGLGQPRRPSATATRAAATAGRPRRRRQQPSRWP